ncbi:HAD-like domain-containing protein [Kalaharituber pfeilii]|nr:HAD-like domain-containing protein [Kalaharituber pfeilii]
MCEDEKYGHFISQAALFDFISTWDKLLVPWRRWDSSHRCLENAEEARVVELVVLMPELLDLDELRRHEELVQFERTWNIEVVLQPHNVFRRHKRLAVFDMDSTLIQQEVIDEIARFVGVEKEVSEITARAMNGEIDFTESLCLRVSLLKGVPSTVFDSLKSVITFTPGARELCKALKALGYKLAVLSGGFIPLANYVKEELGLDYAYANQLVVSEDGTQLTGELTGPIVHAQRKAELLEQIARQEGIPLKQTVAIGDGANDLVMMKKAGLGIAFNAKPKVQAEAPCRLNGPTLRDVLYILGFTKGEQDDLLAL